MRVHYHHPLCSDSWVILPTYHLRIFYDASYVLQRLVTGVGDSPMRVSHLRQQARHYLRQARG